MKKYLLIIFILFSFVAISCGSHSVGNASLPNGFKIVHPRLPHPDQDFLTLLKQNPKSFAEYMKTADEFDPNNPRNQYLVRNLIVTYLVTKKPEYLLKIKALAHSPFPNFWFSKIDCLAIAYDWIYDDLDERTRKAFQERLVKEIGESVKHYKEIRVSPYNDMGYIRLGDTFVVGTIALGADHPKGIDYLQFAEDVILNKYLPVWKQIIGEGGGWHEGIEYLERGVGALVYPILASWGSATGRDFFKENPGLEDFVYFPIYANRPDYTPVRIGDVANCVRISFPDLLSLSVVYDNPYGRWAAYEFQRYGKKVPSGFSPSGWPWGKPDLFDALLKSPGEGLPLAHHFKGWGVVAMRSDWTEDAVYATFRAGDNFWSHQNFDSGAFTIYHKGALAIDSGTYSSGYNSEHHINYAMQTIAHNCLTITDPKDYYPRAKRALPNDGGQRRVGSLYNRSPDDINDWLAEVEDYEMGDITTFDSEKEYTYIKADITAAYQNNKSGNGDYRHRTKRLNLYERDFLYLRPDLFVVVDYVKAMNKKFKKKWLLHTINEPVVDNDVVSATRAERVKNWDVWNSSLKYRSSDKKYYQYHGRLFIKTMLPKDIEIEKVGGPGHEFEVDGVNHNKAQKGKTIQPNPVSGPSEPGSWRIEISPKKAQKDDLFLNVLYACDAKTSEIPKVERLESDSMAGAVIEDSAINRIVLFPNMDNLGKEISSVSFNYKTDKPGRYFLFGMAKGESFKIIKKENGDLVEIEVREGSGDTVSNENGTLVFSL
jgi:heparinase II/III-like protein/uncharacterized protein DUF4962